MLWCDSSGGEKCTTRGVAVTRCAYFDFLRDKTCGDVTELLGSDGGASSLRQSYGSYLFLVRAPVQHTRNTHYQQHNTSKTKMARRARPPAGNRGAHRVHSHPVYLVYFDFLPDEKGWEAVIVKTAFSSKLKPQGWGRQLKNQFDSFDPAWTSPMSPPPPRPIPFSRCYRGPDRQRSPPRAPECPQCVEPPSRVIWTRYEGPGRD